MSMADILKQSEKVQKLFSELEIPMTDEILKNNFKSLYEYSLDPEFDCSDLKKPCQRLNYICKKIKFQNNQFYVYDDYCEHYYVLHPFEKIRKQFIYQNVNMERFDGSLSQIQKTYGDFADEDYKKSMNLIMTTLRGIIDKNATKGIYIYGNVGVGKTHLLKAIAKNMAQNGKTIVVSTVESLLADLRTAMGSDFNPALLTVQKCQIADVLFLDDLGLERPTKWSRDEVLFPILNYRLEHRKLTFFSSNFSLNQLKAHYAKPSDMSSDMAEGMVGSQRIVDRINGMILVQSELKGKTKRK